MQFVLQLKFVTVTSNTTLIGLQIDEGTIIKVFLNKIKNKQMVALPDALVLQCNELHDI